MKKRKVFLGALTILALSITACGGGPNPITDTSSKLEQSSSLLSSSSEQQKSSSSIEEKSSSSSLAPSSSSLAPSSSSQVLSSSSSQAPSSSSLAPSSSSSNKPSSSSSARPSSSSSQSSSSSGHSSSSSNQPQNVSVDIFAINDMHGNVVDTPGKGIGISRSTTVLKEFSKNKNSIFISEGDMWQGSVESNYTRGKLVTEWMNNMNFVSMTVGNHEYDWGKEYIIENQQLANFPTLGINVLDKYSHERVDYLSASTTFTRGGAKFGVIGAIGNCLNSVSSSYVQDVYFATDTELTDLVKAESTRLRNEENCDFIIYSIHGAGNRGNNDSYDFSLSNNHYVDIVLEGHSHAEYCYQDYAGVYHLQAGADNEGMYQITVDINLTNKAFTVNEPVFLDFNYSDSPYRDYEKDAETEALFVKYKDAYEFAYEQLGYNSTYKNAKVLRQKIADLYLEAGLKKWGSQYNIILGGGYLSCRGAGLAAGDVIYAQVDELFPFDNDIQLCSVRGYNLKNTSYILDDNNNYFLCWSDYGNDVRSDIDDYQTYYLISDKYGSDFAPNHLTVVDTLKDDYYARDILADYIREGNWDERTNDEHAGTLEDPKTIAEAREYAAEHPGDNVGSSGAEGFYYTGVVSRQAVSLGSGSGDMKNVYVRDADKENEMLIYYLKKCYDTATYGTWNSIDDLQVGDVIVFWGKAFCYNSSIIEFASGAFVVTINGTPTAA